MIPEPIPIVRSLSVVDDKVFSFFRIVETEYYIRSRSERYFRDPHGPWEAHVYFENDVGKIQFSMILTPTLMVQSSDQHTWPSSELIELSFDKACELFDVVAESIICLIKQQMTEIDPSGEAWDRFQQAKMRLLSLLNA